MSRIQEEVRNRRFAEVVRIEVHPSTPASLRTLLLAEFNAEQDPPTTELSTADVYEVPGLLDIADLMSLSALDLPARGLRSSLMLLPAREVKHIRVYP